MVLQVAEKLEPSRNGACRRAENMCCVVVLCVRSGYLWCGIRGRQLIMGRMWGSSCTEKGRWLRCERRLDRQRRQASRTPVLIARCHLAGLDLVSVLSLLSLLSLLLK